jgi:hypothetical protein
MARAPTSVREPEAAGPAPDDASPPPPATSPSPTRARWSAWIVAALGLLVLVRVVALVGVLHSGQEQDDSIIGGDARRYAQIALAEGTPYKDFAVEYPPIAYGLVRVVAASDVRTNTLLRLGLSQLALDLAIAGVLWWGWNRRTAIAYLVLGLPFLPFPYLYLRIDLLSVFLATLGLALLRRRRDTTGGAVLAASVFAKLWPIAIAPLFILERRGRAFIAWAVTGAVGLLAWVLWAGVDGPVQVFSFRGALGWQVESMPGIFVHMEDAGRAHVEQGAWRTGLMPDWSRPVLTGLSVGFLALGWWWAYRRRREGANEHIAFALAPLAGVLSLLIFAPIISPQYVLWLLPFCAILAAEGDRLIAGFMLAAGALSTLEFALIHAQIDGDLYATAPVVARNVVLVGMLIVVLAKLAGLIGDRACGIPSPFRRRSVPETVGT